jgi:hypothetical protein
MAHLALHADRRFLARAHQIARGLVGRIRDVDGIEFSGTGQARELQTIAPIGLIRRAPAGNVGSGLTSAFSLPLVRRPALMCFLVLLLLRDFHYRCRRSRL